MKICFAVLKDEGVESTVYNHFGSAPAFVVVNTEGNDVSTVVNRDADHIHGACNPIKAIGGRGDAVVDGGIGAGLLLGLNAKGIQSSRHGDDDKGQSCPFQREQASRADHRSHLRRACRRMRPSLRRTYADLRIQM